MPRLSHLRLIALLTSLGYLSFALLPPSAHALSLTPTTSTLPTGATTTSFVYDGDGGRVKVTTSSGTTKFLGASYEIGPDGTTTKSIFAGAQRLCTKDSTGALRYYHTDHLGSSNVITDSTGKLVELAEYTPYGALSRREGATNVPQKYTGKRLDPTGLYFYEARYYDPLIGRFLTADPTIQHPYDPQDLNRYAYARNNPLKYTDPTGLGFGKWLKRFFGVIVGATVGALTFGLGVPLAVALGVGSFFGATSGALMNGVSLGRSLALGAVAGLSAGFGAQFALGAGLLGGAAIGAGFGALGGAASSAILGGDPLRGGLAGAVGGGIMGAAGGAGLSGVAGLAASAGAGAASAAIAGGNPLDGAIMGATATALSIGIYGTFKYVQSSPTLSRILDPIGKLWALPNTILGLAVGVAGMAFGAKPSVGNNAVQFTGNPFLVHWKNLGSAITLGNTSNYSPGLTPSDSVSSPYTGLVVNVGLHEAAHTYQAQVLGPLFLPVYGALAPTMVAGGPHPLEAAADRAAQ